MCTVGGEFVRLGQADHSDLPVQVNLNGAFVWCARADQTDLLLWVENHHPPHCAKSLHSNCGNPKKNEAHHGDAEFDGDSKNGSPIAPISTQNKLRADQSDLPSGSSC